MRYLACPMLRARTSLAVCLLVVAALPIDAHGRAVTEAPAQPEPAPSRTLRSSLGVAKARARLVAADRRERRLGIERLAALGTAESLDVLLEALRAGDTLREPELRLYAVRALAPHAGRSEVRSWLLREASTADARNPGRSRELDALVREQLRTLVDTARARLTVVEVPADGLLEALHTSPVALRTMGRGLDSDPAPFLAAAAAGVHAAALTDSAVSGRP